MSIRSQDTVEGWKNAYADWRGDAEATSLQVKALGRLHELAMLLASTSEPQPAFQAILETLVELHEADFGLFSLCDSATGSLVTAASVGFRADALSQLTAIAYERKGGTCQVLLGDKERIVVEDIETDPRFDAYQEIARSVGFRAVHSTPILTGRGETLGILSAHFKAPQRPTDTEMQLADLCARHAADAMEVAKSRRALRHSEERFARFMEHLPGLAWIKDENGRYVFANAAAQKAFQATAKELYGRTDAEIFPKETARQFQVNDQLAMSRECGVQSVETLVHEDGVVHYSLVNKFPIPSVEGMPPMIGGMAIDVTDRKRAEESLRESEQRFRNMADQAPVMIWVTEADGSCSFLGKTWYEFTGRTPASSLGFGWIEAVHPDDHAVARENFLEANSQHQPFRHEYRLLGKDGYYHWVIDAAQPRFDDNGVFLGYIGSVIDISDRKRIEEALRQREAALKEADRRKDEFLALLAHELRNPLAPIRTGLELMRLASDDPAVVDEVRITMERQTRQMVRLIDDLLDVSRITRGTLELRKSRVELSAVIESAVEAVRPLIQELGHQLEIEIPKHPVVVEADPTRLAQVISNLLHNAAKYMSRGGRIDLVVARQADAVTISIKDKGIGIPREMIDRIFDMFIQVDASLERAHGGLGIGLTLVKRLVEMHGGTVEARSDGLNHGSEFLVHLPIVVELLAEADRAVDGVPPSAARRRILVVDDNETAAHVLAMLLRALGNEVQTAFDGETAIELAERIRPDIMLLDIAMPKMNGYEAARYVRQQPWGKSIVLAALTGWGQEDDKRRTREAGFDHHFVKPLDPTVLQKFLTECEVQPS
ncbi:MAG TPA: PAS domain S-box protein [Lacipirellulaceae bacterium]|nr:PAS domain S-box protein [Lacipirellulaceae bacterium]